MNILVILMALLIAGCSTATMPPVASEGPIAVLGKTTFQAQKQAPPVRRGQVYFRFDSTSVDESQMKDVRRLARYLRNHPANTVQLEGNCDERGGFAYNQRLGASRAEQVGQVLLRYGATKQQIVVISNGEFKPLAHCHEEKCWSVNRRVDLIYGW